MTASHALSQLSYTPVSKATIPYSFSNCKCFLRVVQRDGEPVPYESFSRQKSVIAVR